MTLSECITALQSMTNSVSFKMENGESLPPHFHITEVGLTTKHFIDCGKTIHKDEYVSFQLWYNDADLEHRLKPSKLLSIIQKSKDKLQLDDHEIIVEYQGETIQLYSLKVIDAGFVLVNKSTACLAQDQCIPSFVGLEMATQDSCCSGSNCC